MTLAKDIADGTRIMVYCQNQACNHAWPLDFALAIEKLGPDFDRVDDRKRFLRALICSKCGSRYPATIVSNEAASKASAHIATTWGMIPASSKDGPS